VTDLQDNMVSSAISSAALSIALAFGIILISTLNAAVAFYAIATVIAIVACVMGSIVLMGWELGLLESMCMSILVGMSVDFVVHFAHAWVSDGAAALPTGVEPADCVPAQPPSQLVARRELVARTHTSLSTVGISVLSAGVTTMVAACVLFFGVIVFFSKFGTMLALAMGFSLIYSLFFFHALISWLGPVGRCCQLNPVVFWPAKGGAGP
jgi:predicted RND superfamily exporter protein